MECQDPPDRLVINKLIPVWTKVAFGLFVRLFICLHVCLGYSKYGRRRRGRGGGGWGGVELRKRANYSDLVDL